MNTQTFSRCMRFALALCALALAPVALAQETASQALDSARAAIEQARKAGAEREAAEDFSTARAWLAQAEKANSAVGSVIGFVGTARMKKDREDEILYLAGMARIKAQTAEARAKRASTMVELNNARKTLADYQSAIAIAKEREVNRARSTQAADSERQQLEEAQRKLAEMEAQKKKADEEAQRQEAERAAAEKQRLAEAQARLQKAEQDRAAEIAQSQAKMQALEQERAMVAAAGRIAQTTSKVADGRIIISIPVTSLFTTANDIAPPGRKILDGVAEFLKAYPKNKVMVRGHTDSTGTAALNQQLSEKRAGAVRSYLVGAQAIPAERISSEGAGPAEPVANNTSDAGRALNRRVDVNVLLGE